MIYLVGIVMAAAFLTPWLAPAVFGAEVAGIGAATLWVAYLILLGMSLHATYVLIQRRNELNDAQLALLDAQTQVLANCSGQALADCLATPAPC